MSSFIHNHGYKTHLPDLPRSIHPLTPPETDYEYMGQSHRTVPGQEFDHLQYPSSNVDSPGSLHKKTSSVVYINSGAKEARERVVNRGLKWLVVVFPPASFLSQHGQFGHTLSSGPIDRLSNGILMPLFPSMSSQLSAVAREFNLPSTAGLCLYLNTNQNGLALRPRISDESWSMLWGAQFETRYPLPTSQLPICGQIEFDIDLLKARWYDSWLSTSRKDGIDVQQAGLPSMPHSVAHYRGDSRSTYVDGTVDGNTDVASTLQPSRPPPAAPKMVPRKLSLVDRFDTVSSVRSAPKLPSGEMSPPSPTPHSQLLHALSPILQEEEPKTARKDIDNMVNSWRASAHMGVSPLRSTGQISLDPSNMPNNLGDLPSASSESHEMNLEDYAWSVSSLGPVYDSDYESLPSEYCVPSVHVDRRIAGSVALSPSVCTSFGWDGEDVRSPMSYMSRLPSPDLAGRALSDAPPTPGTATSWGPSSSRYAPSVISNSFRAPSVDLAQRNGHSLPVTPLTATSWGPPSYPVSPVHSQYATRSVDLAQRHIHSRPVTPSTATSWGPPSYPVSPVHSQYALRSSTPNVTEQGLLSVPPTPFASRLRRLRSTQEGRSSIESWALETHNTAEVTSQDASGQGVELVIEEGEQVVQPREFVLPDHDTAATASEEVEHSVSVLAMMAASVATPWTHVWPHTGFSTPANEAASESSATPWNQVWPWASFSTTMNDAAASSSGAPWNQVWPYARFSTPADDAAASTGTPWNQVWPYARFSTPVNDAAASSESGTPWNQVWPYARFSVPVNEAAAASGAPWMQVWPYTSLQAPVNEDEAVSSDAPWMQVWPYTDVGSSDCMKLTVSNCRYPTFELYPAVYPHFELYPPVMRSVTPVQKPATTCNYPYFDLYPAVYPNFNLYPARLQVASRVVGDIRLGNHALYPVFEIYPATYPHFSVYPSVLRIVGEVALARNVLGGRTSYPMFDLYPALYPHFNIYPSASKTVAETSLVAREWSADKPSSYCPAFNIYPAVNPRNLMDSHGSSSRTAKANIPAIARVDVKLSVSYPCFNIYPSVYPFNMENIYPTVSERRITPIDSSAISAYYPHIDIYPPHNLSMVHPSSSSHQFSREWTREVSRDIATKLPTAYPGISIYAAVYPHNLQDIYPGVSVTHTKHASLPSGPLLSGFSQYPVFNIYPALSPVSSDHTHVVNASKTSDIYVALSVRYPCFRLYPPTYPVNLKEIYPVIGVSSVDAYTGNASLSSAYPTLNIYPAVYPHNLTSIYPSTALHDVVNALPRQPTTHAHSVTGKAHRSNVRSHTRQQSSKSLANAPPVPPLPKNVQSLHAVSPVSGLPIPTRRRMAEIITTLPNVYPNVCPYPATYPYFALYPESQVKKISAGPSVQHAVSDCVYPVIDVYPAVYPFVTPYPALCSVRVAAKASAPQVGFAFPPRTRRPKHSHADLHRQVFASPVVEALPLSEARRQPRYTHADLHQQVFASSMTNSQSLPEAPVATPPQPRPLSRSRSGTVSSTKPALPSVTGTSATAAAFKRISSIPRSLPAIPGVPAAPVDGPSRARALGLPSNPAMMKRQTLRPVSSFTALPSVLEPSSSDATGTVRFEPILESREKSFAERPLPPVDPMVQRSSSLSQARRVSVMPVSQNNLGRSDSVPSDRTRLRRPTSVFDRVKAFESPVDGATSSEDDKPMRITMSTLAQFPAPPLPPLPPLSDSRRVSKLDRSKFPFN